MIPDIAILRDRVGKRKLFYSVLALGWTGTEHQQRVLNRAIAIMAVLVIPIAVSVHSVVSFVFSMTLQPMWHSTIFGPYFVVGAIFSGIAALIVTMIIFRKAYGLQYYLKPVHFRYLGQLLLIMSLLWFYFTFAEYLTGYYGAEPEEMKVFWAKFSGPYWPFFWTMVLCNFVVPVLCLARLSRRTVGKVLGASLAVIVGMWLERFIIVVPTLSFPRLPFPEGIYSPTWVEWGLMAGSFGLFSLFYLLFTKFFPIISIWEIREGREVGLREVEERLLTYLPGEAENQAWDRAR
jgi:molybdopterin-containing oxidoreductase family membrane subunit